MIALNLYYDGPDQLLREPPVSHDQEIGQLTRAIAAAYTCRGRLRLEDHQLEGAIADLTTAIDLNPHDTEAYRLRARAYYELGDFKNGNLDLHHVEQLHRDDDDDNSDDRWQFTAAYELTSRDRDGRDRTINSYPLTQNGYDDAVMDASAHFNDYKRTGGPANSSVLLLRQCFHLHRAVAGT